MTFDQLQRYRLAGELAEAIRDRTPLAILDGGSREGFLRFYLPGDRIVNLDRGAFSGEGFVRGDVLRLPFAGRSFDLTVSLDVLEHIPGGRRDELLGELARVSRRGFIVGAPFRGGEVETAEKLAGEFSRRLRGRENEFLSQHRAEGLPGLSRTLEIGRKLGFRTAAVPSGYLPRWLAMICLNEYLGRFDDPGELVFPANRLYHERFYRADNAAPAYRQMILFLREGDRDPEEIAARFAAGPAGETGSGPALDFLEKMLETIESGKDRLIDSLRREEKTRRKRAEEEVRQLTGIIDEKAAELAEILNSRAYQVSRRIFRLFDRSRP